MGRVSGKIALVTGAAQGIGEASAVLLAREGATVYLTDIQDDKGRAIAKRIGGTACYHRLDVRDEDAWQRVLALVGQKHGRLDILVNNAGIIGMDLGPQDPENATLESWRAVHITNADGTFLGCKQGLAWLKKSAAGSIVNISSRSGIVGIPNASPYASSKAAIRNHTKSVALYCAQQKYPVRCNSVHPAAILTPMWDPVLGEGPEREEKEKSIVAGTPLQRWGTAAEVAQAVLYLASDESTYVTGTELTIDGGILAGSTASPKASDAE